MTRLLLLFFLVSLTALGQADYTGTWTGIITKTNQAWGQGNTLTLCIKKDKDRYEVFSREEINGTDFYGIAKAYGTIQDSGLVLKQVIYQDKKGSMRTTWCKLEMDLQYNEMSGYINGEYHSTDCRNSIGKIILYRNDKGTADLSTYSNNAGTSEKLAIDLRKSRNAPEIRMIERQNFQFRPIYFDYDRAEIRPEYSAFLTKMIDIVDGHSDLRIRVTGNTDSDGSDEYNIGLSKRRAQSIIDFFVQNGLSPDRIEIEFNGEKKPADRNDTDEGKQRNRRVEFQFI